MSYENFPADLNQASRPLRHIQPTVRRALARCLQTIVDQVSGPGDTAAALRDRPHYIQIIYSNTTVSDDELYRGSVYRSCPILIEPTMSIVPTTNNRVRMGCRSTT